MTCRNDQATEGNGLDSVSGIPSFRLSAARFVSDTLALAGVNWVFRRLSSHRGCRQFFGCGLPVHSGSVCFRAGPSYGPLLIGAEYQKKTARKSEPKVTPDTEGLCTLAMRQPALLH